MHVLYDYRPASMYIYHEFHSQDWQTLCCGYMKIKSHALISLKI